MNEKIYGVTELNTYIKNLMDSDNCLSAIYLKGEVSNYKTYPSGHHYFTMKDAESSLRCVMFKGSAHKLKFKPENGMSAVAFGKVTVFPRDGAYQLYVSELAPDGMGALHYAYEQLKSKLQNEGLFDLNKKKPLKKFNETVAVITSPAGAVVRDVIRIMKMRWPLTKVIVLPVRVQGSEAPPEISAAIQFANEQKLADLLIVGRGGGSLEDLWAFNDESVVRAIYESEIPVISAVGHEPDVTLSDFVADVRASTPSNAAEMAVPDFSDVLDGLSALETSLRQISSRSLKAKSDWLAAIEQKSVMRDPKFFIDEKRLLIDYIQDKLSNLAIIAVKSRSENFAGFASALEALNPIKVLGRGYALVRDESGAIVKRADDVKSGDRLLLRLNEGELSCVVD